MSAYWSRCEDCVECSVEDCEAVAFCHSEPRNGAHGAALCEDHDMYATGTYSPEADPLYLPEAKAADDAYWDDTLPASDYGANAPASAPGFRYPPTKDDPA